MIGLYFLFSPYQNCKRDYVDNWLDAEKARDKVRFDRMRAMARTRDANTKNRATNS